MKTKEKKKQKPAILKLFKKKKEEEDEIPTLSKGYFPESNQDVDNMLSEYEKNKDPDYDIVSIDHMIEIFANKTHEKLSSENIDKENVDLAISVLYEFIEILKNNNIGFIQYLNKKNFIEEVETIFNSV